MTPGDAHPLFRAAILHLSCTRSGAGQTAEVSDGAGAPVASADGAGTITDPSGNAVLHAPVAFEGRGERGTDAKLEVSDGAGAPLGEVRVIKYSFGPRSSKLTLSVTVGGGEEVARLAPQDRRGEKVEIRVRGAPAGTLQRLSRKRVILRSSAAYRLELTGHIEERLRPLVLAAAIRYQALAAAVADASQRGDR